MSEYTAEPDPATQQWRYVWENSKTRASQGVEYFSTKGVMFEYEFKSSIQDFEDGRKEFTLTAYIDWSSEAPSWDDMRIPEADGTTSDPVCVPVYNKRLALMSNDIYHAERAGWIEFNIEKVQSTVS